MRKQIGSLVLRTFGWTPVGTAPQAMQHCVLIAAPHTSYFDLPLMLAFSWHFEFQIAWLGKHTIFRGPADPFFRWLGGIPVDRRKPHQLVEYVAKEFGQRQRFTLVIAPEGTRARKDFWKSGFYWIAKRSGVPIVPTYLDFKRKRAGFGEPYMLTDSLSDDMDHLRAFYAGSEGRHPQRSGPIRLRDED